jgi:DNA-binding phage protein
MTNHTPPTTKAPRLRLNSRAIRIALATNDITIRSIAEQMGVTRETIYRAMRGQNTTLDTVSGIAAVLGVDPLSILKTEG